MNYEAIKKRITLWYEYNGSGDEYRKTHDLDCILTGGNLNADTIFSLWLPLRYLMEYISADKWIEWKKVEKAKYEIENKKGKYYTIKYDKSFLIDLRDNIELFIPENKLSGIPIDELFELGLGRENVMIIPYRLWQKRGEAPYYEYMPHFLFDLLNTNDENFSKVMIDWMQREHLEMFFEDEAVDINKIKDLGGTTSIFKHSPSEINVEILINNYVDILKKRKKYFN